MKKQTTVQCATPETTPPQAAAWLPVLLYSLVHYCHKVVTKNCNVSTNVHKSHNIKCIKIYSVGLKLLYVEADEANKHILQPFFAVVQKDNKYNHSIFPEQQVSFGCHQQY